MPPEHEVARSNRAGRTIKNADKPTANYRMKENKMLVINQRARQCH